MKGILVPAEGIVNSRKTGMSSTTPIRSGTEPEIDEETRRILAERDATFDQDKLTAVDAREAIAEIRRKLKTPQLR
jgi:hypothetical protein